MTDARAGVIRDILDQVSSLMTHVADVHATEFLGVDVTMSQAKCLYVVSVHPGIGMSALAEQLNVTPAALSGLVDRLVEHGYLVRREDPSDRRQLRVTLTDPGREVFESIRELNEHQLRTLLAGLSGEELDALRIGIAALDREATRRTEDPASPLAPSPERNLA